MKTYIVDIDNTICVSSNSDYTKSIPMHDRIESINRLRRDGNRVIYWTARGAVSGIDWTEFTIRQLNSWKCEYDEIRMGKPNYDVWIDDKAFNSEEFFK